MEEYVFQKIDPSDKALMHQVYRLRFQVYGRECGFISERDYPEELEIDEYDPQSLHFAAINSHREVVGSMRMILSKRGSLPITNLCDDISEMDRHILHTPHVAEISRLVISKKLLQTRKKLLYPLAKGWRKRKHVFADAGFLSEAKPIIMGLCSEAYRESLRQDIRSHVALMERGLWTLLKMYGLKFRCVGNEVNFYGMVRPYIGNVSEMGETILTYQFEQDTSDAWAAMARQVVRPSFIPNI